MSREWLYPPNTKHGTRNVLGWSSSKHTQSPSTIIRRFGHLRFPQYWSMKRRFDYTKHTREVNIFLTAFSALPVDQLGRLLLAQNTNASVDRWLLRRCRIIVLNTPPWRLHNHTWYIHLPNVFPEYLDKLRFYVYFRAGCLRAKTTTVHHNEDHVRLCFWSSRCGP